MTSARERLIRVNDGTRLFIRDFPGPCDAKLPPLLCLHGLTRNSKDFLGVAQMFGDKRRVIIPDMRGRGKSDYATDWRTYNPETYIGDVKDMLCALNVHKVVVIGTSMGGIMAMGMSAAMPTTLAGMVINDVGTTVHRSSLAPILTYMKDSPVLNTWVEAGHHLRRAFEDQIPTASHEAWTRAARLSYRERAGGAIVFNWDNEQILKAVLSDETEVFDIWHLFRASSRFPMLVVRGALSTILTADQLAEMQGANPALRSVTVAGRGHAPTLSEPECVEALNAFLSEV